MDVQRVDQGVPGIIRAILAQSGRGYRARLAARPDAGGKGLERFAGPAGQADLLMEDYVLARECVPIVLAMDEVDRLLQTSFHSDFFGHAALLAQQPRPR